MKIPPRDWQEYQKKNPLPQNVYAGQFENGWWEVSWKTGYYKGVSGIPDHDTALCRKIYPGVRKRV